jgi:hypothetical protein
MSDPLEHKLTVSMNHLVLHPQNHTTPYFSWRLTSKESSDRQRSGGRRKTTRTSLGSVSNRGELRNARCWKILAISKSFGSGFPSYTNRY